MTIDKGNLTSGLVVIGKNWNYFDVKILSISTWKVHENEMMKLRDQQDTSLQHWLPCNSKIWNSFKADFNREPNETEIAV